VEREDSFDDEDVSGGDGLGFVGDAGVGGEVVEGARYGFVIGQSVDLFDEEGVFEGVGVVEVLQVAVFVGEMAEVAVVEVERQEGGVELRGELAGEGGFAGAGATTYPEDERATR
jgi:hypothetical protein